jgi:hypothetical protein
MMFRRVRSPLLEKMERGRPLVRRPEYVDAHYDPGKHSAGSSG